ncbi:splicing factor U2af large subunit B [Cinnamomum micranthum f. kanehirae]|uniref:Splicing factor U2af large subunit B n=1 Tax=Cinnamomum micranthum f. kanehirae TaxID=337451 RepID=A0A3S3R7M1_9MAGN|nr:splicing factor U2af large subunit B [Cinnamomum micranthum f. kanehirae]
MGRSSRQKDKYGNSKELSRDDSNEGTAARTRPFSFEEIMRRRKQKKLAGDVKEEAGEPIKSPGKDNSEYVPQQLESEGSLRKKKDFILGAMKTVSNDTLKEISRKKEERITKKEGEFAKDKGNHEKEANLKVKSSKDKSIRDKGDKNEKRSHHRSRMDERLKSDFENEPGKKLAKDIVSKYGERDRSSHRESKRKHRSGNDEKSRSEADGGALKKHDSGKWQNTEHSERKGSKKESSQHQEEVRQKRRRSRSREHVRDRDRRSSSMSPRAHKRVSYHGREHEESSHHLFKGWSGRQDKNRMPSNGGHGSGHYRRHGVHSSGLGGYSPRKRRTEAAAKTPSPTIRSPERKSTTWDLPPPGTDEVGVNSFLSSLQSVQPVAASNAHDLPPGANVTPSTVKSQPVASANTISTTKGTPVDSIQLTQATRPMRRLYVENVPASATDKAIVECFNNFLLSSGVNYIQGRQPCISCIINKEKGHALVEFLTPEDATSALSFDGRSFTGSILKIRRPKDFVEVPTRIPEKPAPTVAAISDVVNDSQHKIFIGGISKALSSDMLMEIVSAFGLLKAYHFEINEEFDEPFAFLEYIDQSATLKACAGLNGMKLAGNILTAVQAIPDVSGEENAEKPPFYGIPDHAKPLLEKPTQVLKIKNVFKAEEFSLLSESELEETLEDVRFGTVKSVNVIRYNSNDVDGPEAIANAKNSNSNLVDASKDLGVAENTSSLKEYHNDDSTEEVKPPDDVEENASPKEHHCDVSAGDGEAKPLNDVEAAQDIEGVANVKESPKTMDNLEKSEPADHIQPDSNIISAETLELDTEDQPACLDNCADFQGEEFDRENCPVPEDPKQIDIELQDDSIESKEPIGERSDVDKGNTSQQACNLELFEEGCILIEYARKEAACVAAHCLHRRPYGDQIVVVGYIPYDMYRARFPR